MTESKISFTESIAKELYELPVSTSCCQKALLCGLLYGCRKNDDGRGYEALFYRENDAQLAARVLDSRFSSGKTTEIRSCARGGHRAYAVEVTSKALAGVFADIDGKRKDISRQAYPFSIQQRSL